MSVFVVTWNLNKEKSNYDAARRAFIAKLDQYDTIRDRGLESVRFVSTTGSASQLSEALRTQLDDNDRLFVSKLNKHEHAGWLQKDVWNWIDARL